MTDLVPRKHLHEILTTGDNDTMMALLTRRVRRRR